MEGNVHKRNFAGIVNKYRSHVKSGTSSAPGSLVKFKHPNIYLGLKHKTGGYIFKFCDLKQCDAGCCLMLIVIFHFYFISSSPRLCLCVVAKE